MQELIKGRGLRGGYNTSTNQRDSGEEYRAGIPHLTAKEEYEGRRALSHNQWELRDINDTEGSGRRGWVYIN